MKVVLLEDLPALLHRLLLHHNIRIIKNFIRPAFSRTRLFSVFSLFQGNAPCPQITAKLKQNTDKHLAPSSLSAGRLSAPKEGLAVEKAVDLANF